MPENNSKIVVRYPFIHRHYRLLVCMEILLLCAIGWFTFLRQQYEHLQERGFIGQQAAMEERNQRQQYLDQLKQMNDAYAAVDTERLQQMNVVLPEGIDATATMAHLQRLADAASMHVLSVDVVESASSATNANANTSGNTDAAAITTLPTSIGRAVITLNIESATGSYDALKDFLNLLQSSTPLLDLRNLSYSPSSSSFAVQLETYYRKSPSTPSSL
ncbi:MAG: hypothetical protein HYV32_06645 [Candidatus Kerfeldbacteria bacterium]|nr:hypothetical protein [Candidatus Kerfeldbacteria bacterium]